MDTKQLIPANEFCTKHNIEISFISALYKTGLIEIITIAETGYIHSSQLPQLEKIIRLYYELDINLEGIETIMHLLRQIMDMQEKITVLQNKLRLFEEI